MKPGSSPGVDGIPAEIYIQLALAFLQPMTDAIGQFLLQGSIPAGWALGVMSPIPKEQGSISMNALRPICLQNVIFKWVSAPVLLMMEDIVAFAPPPPRSRKPSSKVDSCFITYGTSRGHWKL